MPSTASGDGRGDGAGARSSDVVPVDEMRLTIVRHARARSKKSWRHADDLRPLDEIGETQAARLADIIGGHPIARLVSSPAQRCVQTLQPLSAVIGLPIEQWEGLGRDAGASHLMGCLGDLSFDDAVLCTHGELIRPLVQSLDLRKLSRRSRPIDVRTLLIKGSALRLRIEPTGRVIKLDHLIIGV